MTSRRSTSPRRQAALLPSRDVDGTAARVSPSTKLMVTSAPNCPFDLDDPATDGDVFDWPAELDIDSQVVVAGLSTTSLESGVPALWTDVNEPNKGSAFGAEDVDIGAPADFFSISDMNPNGGATAGMTGGGTSNATALISGVLGLLVAQQGATAPDLLRNRLIGFSDRADTLEGLVSDEGRIVNACTTVLGPSLPCD